MSCPDENVLMAMVEQALDPGQQHEVEVHIDRCEDCRRVMASVVGARVAAAGTPRTHDEIERFVSFADAKFGERYSIESVLGRGGMGTVYLARDLTLGRDVALKLHRAGSGNDRLHREAVAMAKLAHPNVVTVFEVATVDDRLYVAMEYVRGETLRGWLASTPRRWREIVELLIDAGKGLAAAHAAGLVHRDFKPENVLVGEDGRPRVSDFGLARVDARPGEVVPLAGTSSVDTPATMTDSLMGTPAYMAPELLDDGRVADARSDQFAFCVVAWECLFGVRPFAGATLAAMALAAERRELQRPARTDVPPRVRDVIERGLLIDPAARHDDMPALLDALRHAATPRAKRRVAIGVGAAVILGSAIALTTSSSGGNDSLCAVGDDAFAGVWDPALKDKIHGAFMATGIKDSAQILQRVEGVIAEYRRSWIAMRRSACEATRLHGEQSEALLDLRMECLDHKRDELRALTNGLLDADRPAVMGSVRATLGLTAVTECADIAALGAPVRPPVQPIRDRVEAERSELATVRALRLLGRIGPALDKTEAIAARAKSLDYRPLDAEVLSVLGDLKDRSGDTAAAIKLVEQSVVAAEAGNHKLVAAQAWSNLAWMLGYEERQFDRAEFAVRMAGAAIENLGGNDELSAQLTNYEALILETKGQLGPAKTKYLAALAARERMNQHDSWQISLVLNDLGGIERKLDDFVAARAHHERALAIRRNVFGELHPYVVSSLINLGNVAWSQHDYPEAQSRFQAALRVADEVFPANHPQKALALANLASVFDKQGKYDESVRAYRRALEVYEAVRGSDHADVADTLHNLGNVLATVEQYDAALQAYERALPILDKEGDDPALASLLFDFGDLLVRKHDYARAEKFLQRSLAIGSKARSDDPDLANAQTVLGELYTATGRAGDAGPLLERALVLRKGDSVAPDERARTELALAKLLWQSPASRPRAVELANSAKSHLEHAGPGQHKAQLELSQWIQTHP